MTSPPSPVQELYSPDELLRLERRTKRAGRAAILTAALTLAGCILLCCLAPVRGAENYERAAVLVSILGGWTVIYLYNNPVVDLRRELRHAHMLREEQPRETLEGVLAVSKDRMRIRGSIRFYALTLTDGAEKQRAMVVASRAPILRGKEGKRLRLYTVNGYAAAYEEL